MARKGDILVYGPTILPSNDDGDRNIFVSTADPVATTGQDGDVWLKYTLA